MITPVRRQYLQVKKQHPEAIVLFRLGDFYETFDDDAKLVARELEITLTSREMGKGQRVPLAGIPYHALDNYLARLVGRGYKVAICEQMAEASEVKGIIPREVVRVITPGTVVEASLLVPKENNYLAAALEDKGICGLAYVDVTTGEFATTQLPLDALYPELERLRPSELLVPRGSAFSSGLDFAVSALEEWSFELDSARQLLFDHFRVASLEGYGCSHLPLAVRAAGAILQYLGETQKSTLQQLTALSTYSVQSFMVLDPSTRRSLDLWSNSRSGRSSGSLLSIMDQTRTPMGGRLLRRWLSQPLLDLDGLVSRQDSIGAFHGDATLRAEMGPPLAHMPDMERLTGRVSAGGASPREVVALGHALDASRKIRDLLAAKASVGIMASLPSLDPCDDLSALIREALVDSPPANLVDGGVIREGFSAELDRFKTSVREARQFIAGLERRERERTGVKSLKVGYNRVFGYYIEVSKANAVQVPSDYVRKQTLVGAERFITPELKEYEDLILNAQERMVDLETTLFRQVCQTIASRRESLLNTAGALAHLDTFCSLAELAVTHNYVRPELTEEEGISILGGRHPVVERHLAPGEVFVPNDTVLCSRDAQIAILTGPNMAGKSTYLRQVALVILLAQIGSFVPAQSARLGLVDRIFSRVGAQDDLAFGQSTFMVEMTETANILNHATRRSLIILDEIGRGTSTYDGLAIARSVIEYLHNHPRLGCKTLFATHYHELVGLAEVLPRVRNFNVAVTEEGGRAVFLHKIMPGGADKSYGIHVAQLAGLPRPVTQRAQEILADLEKGQPAAGDGRRPRSDTPPIMQLPLFPQKSP
ncbi:MAG: DNA mismatch repair protein MutS, partial [Dehalococcoidia bacterium]|nr:DNA mismatch repair protein MutS [Dehalococcoidia bacterium]